MSRRLHVFNVLTLLCAFCAAPMYAADSLKDDLNALEDLPDDAATPPQANPSPAKTLSKKVAPKTARASTDPLDDLPPADDTELSDAAPKKGSDQGMDDLNLDDKSDELSQKDNGKGLNDKSLDEDLPSDDTAANEAPKESPMGDLDNDLNAVDEADKDTEKNTTAMTGVDAEAAAKVVGLDFNQLQDRVRLTIRADRSIDWKRELRSRRRQVIIELKNANVSRTILKRVLDTGEFEGPVALVQAFDSKVGGLPAVKILFQLRQFVDPTIGRAGNDVVVDFPIYTDSTLFKSRGKGEIVLPETFLTANAKMSFTGNKIRLNVKDAELPDVLNLLSRASGKNFVLPGSITAKVTLNVKDVPWDQALAIILLNAKLGYQKIGNTYRIAPASELKQELADASDAINKAKDLLPTETKLFTLSYAKATDINTVLADFRSTRGKSSVDARTNSIVVTDIPENLEKMTNYIRAVDKQTAQVLIEGRVVEASKSFLRTLNIDWKVGETRSGALADSFVNVGAKGNTLQTSNVGSDLNKLDSIAGGLRLKLGKLGSIGAIQALLGMGEKESKAKIIASPRITVLDNRTATISEGSQKELLTPGTANTQQTTSLIPVLLKLNVTPQVTADGFVMMKIELNRDSLNSDNKIQTRSAISEMLVESGKTAVLGGTYTIDTGYQETGWPGLRSLPLFGILFKNLSEKRNDTKELIMFISPTILNSEKALIGATTTSEAVSRAPREKDDLDGAL